MPMNESTKYLLVFAGALSLIGSALWWMDHENNKAEEVVAQAEETPAKEDSKPKAQSPARKALEKYRKKGMRLPLTDDPVQRNRAISQRLARKKAQLRSYDQADKELKFEAPAMLKKLDPEAAAEWDDRHRVHQAWRKEIEGEVETLRQLQKQSDALAAKRQQAKSSSTSSSSNQADSTTSTSGTGAQK